MRFHGRVHDSAPRMHDVNQRGQVLAYCVVADVDFAVIQVLVFDSQCTVRLPVYACAHRHVVSDDMCVCVFVRVRACACVCVFVYMCAQESNFGGTTMVDGKEHVPVMQIHNRCVHLDHLVIWSFLLHPLLC